MKKRVEKLQAILRQDGLDGVLYASSANMQYLLDDTSYYWQRSMETGGIEAGQGPNGHFLNRPDAILYVPADGEPILFLTYNRAETMGCTAVRQVVDYYSHLPQAMTGLVKGKKIGYGESCDTALQAILAEAAPLAQAVSAEYCAERLRVVKDEKEIAALRKAAAFTDAAMAHTVQYLRPGVTRREVSNIMAKFGRDRGIRDLPFPATCLMVHTDDPDAKDVHAHGLDVPMQPGTSLGFDFGYVLDGYCSDFGRSFYCGKAQPLIADAYKALQQAQLELFSRIRPGIGLGICFDTLYASLEPTGYAPYLRKHMDFGLMGHQIGIDVHERPWLHSDQEAVFQPGMVMCIEPKIWIPGKVFMRVEDMVLITETGCESLTAFDRELYELPI